MCCNIGYRHDCVYTVYEKKSSYIKRGCICTKNMYRYALGLYVKKIVELFLRDSSVDCVFVGIVPHVDNIKATPQNCYDENSLANILARLYKKCDKPMVVSVNAGEYYKDFVYIMEKAGMPVYNDIRSAVRVLDLFCNYFTR